MSVSDTLIGRNMHDRPDCLGVYISLDEIYVAQTARKDGGIVLESLVRVPINNVDRATLKPLELNETFFAQEGWRDALGKVTSKKKWKTNNVVVTLAPAFCLLRHFIIPTSLERKQWKSTIPLEARKYIHFPFEKAEYAYHAYEFETATTKQKRLGVVFTMTTKNIIDRLRKGFKAVGLNLVSVETAALSLGRAFADADKEAVGSGGRVYSFFSQFNASFVFLNEHVPVLLREVEIAGSAPAEHRHFEITNSTEFISKQLEKDPFEEVVVTGHHMDQWVPVLESDSKKPVRRWDLKEVYGIETRSKGEIAAIGASIKFFDNKSPDIDFTKGTRLSTYEYNASLTCWKLVGVAVLVMLLIVGISYLKLMSSNRDVAAKRKEHKTSVDEFKGMSSSQISNNLNSMKTQNSNLGTLLKYNTFITPIFAEIVDSMPNNVWANSIRYTDVFPPKGQESRSIVLEGRIKTDKGGSADMALGNQFRDKFVSMPTIKQICGNTGAITFSNVAGSGANKETSFVLNCTPGGGSAGGSRGR